MPAYLVSMVPRIMIESVAKAAGNSVGLGKQQTFNMKFTSPSYGTDVLSNKVMTGAHYGIAVKPNKMTKELLLQRKSKLENAMNAICSTNMFDDNCLGEILYITASSYFYELDAYGDSFAKTVKVADLSHPSEAMVSKEIDVTYFMGLPVKAAEGSVLIDVDRIIHSSVALNGDLSKEKYFTMSIGQTSSALEHGIFEQLYNAKGVSTIQFLKTANDQGMPIYTINQSNVAVLLPKISVSNDVKTDIQNAVNAGKTVVISEQNITYYGVTGVGFIIMDPDGSGAYMISVNSAAGGQCIIASGGIVPQCLHYYEQIWHVLDNIVVIASVPTVIVAVLVLIVKEIGWAGLAFAFGMSLLAILIGALIAVTVIYLITLMTQNNNQAKVEINRRLYVIERRLSWLS